MHALKLSLCTVLLAAAVPASATAVKKPVKKPAAPAAQTCVIKGNINKKERIYHLPGCASYKATVIDTAAGEKWFCNEAEAKTAGWRKAKNCPK